jgi:hypothetical protein
MMGKWTDLVVSKRSSHMRSRFSRVLIGLLLASVLAMAQVATSRLEGTVEDSTGSVVPGAKVEVLNTKTQVRNETTANAEGRYMFASLQPGEYTLTVEAAGFRKAVKNALVLNVAQTVSEVIKLEVGSVSESVVVEANAVRVTTTDAQVGNVISLRDIDVLPSLGRAPIGLGVYNPGTQIDPSDSTFTRVNGTRQGSNNATLDGVEVNDPMAPRYGLVMVPTSTDTVEEFRIVTSGGKAEYGRSAGGQVQMITRSGTNRFHGAAYDYLRNTALNANNFFNNQSGGTRPKFIQNIFGGRFEGPIRRDRTFFFVNYQGSRTRQEVVRNRTVPSTQLLQGIFRWNTPGTTNTQSFDIFRNDPRSKGMDAALKSLYAKYPAPNNTDLGDRLNYMGFRFNNPVTSFNDQYTFKVDHQLTNKNRLFFRMSWMRTFAVDNTNSADAAFPGEEQGRQGGHRRGFSAGSDWNISPTIVNELRVGQQKTNSDFLRPRLHETMFVTNTFTDPGQPTNYSQGRTLPVWQITDNLTKIRGKHTIKFGGEIRIVHQYTWREDNIWPTVYFSTSFAPVPGTIGPSGNTVIASADRTRFESMYNELLGRMGYVYGVYYSDLQKFLPEGKGRERNHIYNEYSFFLQDDWRVSRRLTLNAGLRYEFFGVPYERDGLQGVADQAALMNSSYRSTNIAVQKGGSYWNNDLNNFAPRLGFAWDVFGDGKTSLRGGAGIYYDRMINSPLTAFDGLPGFSTGAYQYPNTATGADVRVSDGVPKLVQPTTPQLTVPATRSNSITVPVPDLRTGYVGQFNLSVQRELLRNTVLELGYVGTRGVKLFMHQNLNQFRIYDSFLPAFKELAALRANTPASNVLVRMFGSAATAVSAIGTSNLDNGIVGTAANTVDTNYYTRYANAGLPDTWIKNFPQFTTAYIGTNSGRSYYNSLQASVRRQTGALKFTLNYTFSKSMDNWNSEGNGTNNASAMDWFNLALNRGRSDFDKTHAFNALIMYTLPVGKGRKLLGDAPRIVDSLLGGWEIGLIPTWQSGSVFTVSSGRAIGPNNGASSWVTYTGDRSIGALDRRGDGVYMFSEAQKAAFGFPEAGTIGTAGRNTFRGPRYFNADISLLKRFKVTEKSAFTFRAEAYNLTNTATFGTPAATLTTLQSVGKFSGTIGGARVMQMALRFDF